jgi:hypothetical protein
MLKFIALIFVIAAIFAYPTMWIVNYLFSATVLTLVFGISKLTFWKALALNWFLGLLRGGSTSSSKS